MAPAIWSGKEALYWGGGRSDGVYTNEGVRYNPTTNKWNKIATDGAPSGRRGHVSVWTGSEMLVWGGISSGLGSNGLGDGGAYTPPN